MKQKFKKFLSAVSALAVTIAVLPITELSSIAEGEMEEVTNNHTDFSSFEDDSATKEGISDSDLVVSTFDEPMIMVAETGVTKEKWIHDLVTAFDMSIEDESTIESHFTDIADSPYAYDIDLAANYGVFDIESESFDPNGYVTREFAAHTANYCFGYLDDGTTVTFADSDDIYYEYDAVVSVQKGWFKTSSNKFLPNALLTENEAENILNDAKSSLESVVIDENAAHTIDYANSVVQLDDSVNASYFNGTVTIKGTSVSVKKGNTFCVNIDGMDKLYKASSVTKDAEGNTVIAVTDASLKDAVSAIDIQGYGDVDYSNAMFYGTSSSSDKVRLLQYKPNLNGVQSQLVKAVNIKNDTISIDEEIDMGGASIKLNGTIKNITPEYKLDYDGVNVNSFYLNVDADADISCTMTGNLIKDTSSKEVNLAKVPVNLGGPMSANIVISVSVSVSGEITMKYSWDINSGVSYTKAGGWRVTKDFKKKGFSLTATGSEKIAIKAALNAEVFGCKIGELYVMGGESGKFTNTPRNDGAVFCDNLKVYAFAEAGANLNLFDVVKFSQSYEFINFNNSPLRYNKHWENGVEVAECSFDKSATSTMSKRTANKATTYSNYSTYGLEYEGIITLANSANSDDYTPYQTWTESRTLTGNVTVNGDLYLENDVDLNGYTLTINGNLIQSGGQIVVKDGTLNINGDYTITNKTHIDSKTGETKEDSNGTLYMDWADGTVNVHGDFYMKSNWSCSYYSGGYNYFKRGILAIDGNFYQYNNISSNSKQNFQATGATVKFVGSGIHEIYFESDSSYIGDNLEVPDDAKIKFTGVFHGFKLAQNIVIDGDTTYDCEYMDLNGYTLTINGNFVQNGGQIQIYGGTLNVNGDYTIQNKTHIDPKTKEVVQDSNGTLYMEYADGTVNVHGDFYMKSNWSCGYYSGGYNYFKRGILAIDGNFYQYNNISSNSKQNFQATGATVKFVGKGTHKITSESSETKIPDIALTDGATLSFNGNFGGFSPVTSCTFSSSAPTIAKVTGNTIQTVGSGTAKIKIEDTSNKSTTINLIVNELVTCDANGDGKLTVADAVLLQKWLLAVPHVRLANWEACDLYEDGVINVFDLCLLKRKLING